MSQGHYVNQWPIQSLSGRTEQDKICRRCNQVYAPDSKGKFCPRCGGQLELGPSHQAVYKISMASDGHFECSCGAWKFQRPWLNHGTLIPKEERYAWAGSGAGLEDTRPRPDGHCKHIQFVIDHRMQMEEAIATHATVRIENSESVIDIQDGRITGFLDKLGRA